MRIHPARRQLTVKVVYYGPGLGGKTTNIRKLRDRFPSGLRGELLELDTATERTLFFDYLPTFLGRINGFKVKVDFFTVPGQSFYTTTRRAVLEGADGIVFVADSSPQREEANQVSKDDLVRQLAAMERSVDELALVYQWNKRDVPRALPVTLLERTINTENAPAVQAIATHDQGVWEAHQILLGLVFDKLRGTRRTSEHGQVVAQAS